MIYDRLDKIPLKIYLEITQTGNLTLLIKGKEKLDFDKLDLIWQKLKLGYDELGLGGNSNKVFNLSVRIEKLIAKYDFVNMAILTLKFDRNLDLENKLRELGYTLREISFLKDLNGIERETSDIIVKVGRLEKNLPKNKKNAGIKSTIDKVIMSYCVITKLDYKPNKITVTEFHSLKELFEEEIKEKKRIIELNKKKNGRR